MNTPSVPILPYVKIVVRDELAEMLAKSVCPAEKEQAEILAVSTQAKGSMIAGFDVIVSHVIGPQWLYFAFFGRGCDPRDRGWIGYGGFGKSVDDARAQLVEFKQWFAEIHKPQGGASFWL